DQSEFASVIEQVAADASLYLRDKEQYANMVAVVWDDSRHSERHAELEQGLLAISGVVGVVVLTRPGSMGPGRRARRSASLKDQSENGVANDRVARAAPASSSTSTARKSRGRARGAT